MCISVSPSPTLVRSETLMKHLQMDISCILTLTFLCVCVTMLLLSKIDLNCRFVPFNVRLNTLAASARSSRSRNVQLFLCFVLYLIIFDLFLIILLPYEFFNIKLDNLIVRQSIIFMKMFHGALASIILKVCYRLTSFAYINIISFYHYPHEILAIWYLLLRITLCPDVHPNPGPDHTNIFAGGLSFIL